MRISPWGLEQSPSPLALFQPGCNSSHFMCSGTVGRGSTSNPTPYNRQKTRQPLQSPPDQHQLGHATLLSDLLKRVARQTFDLAEHISFQNPSRSDGSPSSMRGGTRTGGIREMARSTGAPSLPPIGASTPSFCTPHTTPSTLHPTPIRRAHAFCAPGSNPAVKFEVLHHTPHTEILNPEPHTLGKHPILALVKEKLAEIMAAAAFLSKSTLNPRP